MFEPVKNTRVYEKVVEQIKDMIIKGTLKKGDKLPTERELAERLGVSRTSIREAIRALEVIGLVESRQGSGNFIRESFKDILLEPLSMMFILEKSNPKEILELREVLELQTVVLASYNINEEEIVKLKTLIEEMLKCSDENISVELDKEFHYTIAKASHNRLIINVLEVLSYLIDKFIKDSRKNILADKSNREKLNHNHENIFKALECRDSIKARISMEEHFKLIKENFTE
ncbi:FadR/GntR family transcriptional regulator [Clostridium amazonitimonense]|uniref:FadR/GntR family transcriptional regulator n=1 Tax=Clostridium amazonitimonense TaxID=1499689 RepID=UPI000509FCA6|nr:FadR/GntR family transcriptional regulator [Clostridium amazonitimonense]